MSKPEQPGSLARWYEQKIAGDVKAPVQFSKLALACLLVLTLFASLFLSASPTLHERFHSDAAQSSHQCAITVLQQQQLLNHCPSVVIIDNNWKELPKIAEVVCSPVSDQDYSLSASRAPPVSLSPLA